MILISEFREFDRGLAQKYGPHIPIYCPYNEYQTGMDCVEAREWETCEVFWLCDVREENHVFSFQYQSFNSLPLIIKKDPHA